jgi:hypothetical protein
MTQEPDRATSGGNGAAVQGSSRVGVYPLDYGWGWSVVAPDGTRVTGACRRTQSDAQKCAQREADFRDQLERDRVDGVTSERTTTVLERGVRACTKCGKPHDLVATTRRGKRWGQTWASPDCASYHAESWESLARRPMSGLHPSKRGPSGSAEPLRPEVAPNPEGGHQ